MKTRMSRDEAERSRAAADFAAGTRDEASYADAENGVFYRQGWQTARRASEGKAQRDVAGPDAVGQWKGPITTERPIAKEETLIRDTMPAYDIVKERPPCQNFAPKPQKKAPPADQLDLFA